jgi:hypothetical protein
MVSFELSEVRAGIGGLVRSNEADLAACGGHDFKALNTHLYNANFVCRVCGGVVDYLTALHFGARMNRDYYARIRMAQIRIERGIAA